MRKLHLLFCLLLISLTLFAQEVRPVKKLNRYDP